MISRRVMVSRRVMELQINGVGVSSYVVVSG
jgi:hypothetical protein